MSDASTFDLKKLRDQWRVVAASEAWRDGFSNAFVVALATIMLFPALQGDWPIGHDHPVHIFRIWQLGQTIRHHPFSLWGWSNQWFAGYPQNVIYPIGADLFVLVVRALTFGLLSLGQAYGLAFWLFYVLYGYAVYYFVRYAVASRVAGLIAVVFLLTDPGSNDIGGWFWLVDVGVWTAGLGLVPALIALVQIERLFREPTPRRAALLAVCFGLALLCHPLLVIFFGIAVPLLCLCQYLTTDWTTWKPSLALLGLAALIGGLIASFWLVPYFATLPYAGEFGASGPDLSKMGEHLINGRLYDRMQSIAAGFGLIGAICLLRSRRTLALFTSLFIFVALVISTSTFAGLFGHAAATWLGKNVIATRMLMLAKPFWFGAAGFLIVKSFAVVRDLHPVVNRNGLSRLKQAVMAAMILVFVAPLLFQSLRTFWKWEVRRPTVWYSERKDLKARREFLAWLKNEVDRPNDFFRIAHGFDLIDHDLTDLAIEAERPFYKIGQMPTGHFKYAVSARSEAAFRVTNVRFAISHKPLPPRPDLQLIKTFQQQLYVYQFRSWNPVPFEVNGAGPVELLEFRDNDIALRAGDGAQGSLRLNVSYYPKWRATRDGAPVTITPVTVPNVDRAEFIQIPLAPGTYRFHYAKDASDYLGWIFCGLGLGGCAVLWQWHRLRAATASPPWTE